MGLSPPLIETPQGWLLIYHGVKTTAAGCLYRIGLALLDLDRPDVCLLRGDSWVFGPETSYETSGDVPNVAFPCGYTIGAEGDTINLYDGAADTCIGLATASLKDVLRWLDDTVILRPARRATFPGRSLATSAYFVTECH